MTVARLHYMVAGRIGVSGIDQIFAIRCSGCDHDFHVDFEPFYCPLCGAKFARHEKWGEKSDFPAQHPTPTE